LDLVKETLNRLKTLYEEENLAPGILRKAALMPKWNAVIGSRGQCGISMNFTDCAQAFGKPVIDLKKLQSFIGASLFDVASVYIQSDSWQERSVGVSAMSALSQPLITPDSLRKRGFHVSDKPIRFSSLLKSDDIAAVVGYGGELELISDKCKELHITDLRPREAFQTILIDSEIRFTPRRFFVHSEEENAGVLSKATAVLISGASLVNGTIGELLSYVNKPRVVSVWGPSAAMIPDVLFEQGVHFIESCRIADPQAFENSVIKNKWDLKTYLSNEQIMQTISREEIVNEK
jgi:uncharacterized protein (DUF4213/DUF364 family)